MMKLTVMPRQRGYGRCPFDEARAILTREKPPGFRNTDIWLGFVTTAER